MALALAASPAVVSSSTVTATTASYTPPANTLLVAVVAVGNPAGTATATTGAVTDSLGSTWTLKKRQNSTSGTGCAEVWMMDAGASPAARTITLTGSKKGTLLAVTAFTGAAATASQTGATAGSATTNANTLPITPTATGSYIVGSASDSVVAYSMVAAASTTLLGAFNDATNGGCYGAWRSTATTASTTAQTYGVTPAPTNETEKVAVEVLASTGGTALTVSAALTGSGTLTGSGYPGRLLVSNLGSIATDATRPTTANSNMSADANNTAPTITSSLDLTPPHTGSTTVQKFTTTTGVAALVGWDTTKWTPSTPVGAVVYGGFYLYVPSAPGGTVGLAVVTNTTWSQGLSVRLTAAMKLQVWGTGSVLLGTTSTTIPTGQWVRIEFRTFIDSVNGQGIVRVFTDPESITPTETFTSTTGNTSTSSALTSISRVAIGNIGTGTTATYYLADVVWDDTDWVGPFTQTGAVASSPAVSTLTDDFSTQDATKWGGWSAGAVDWLSAAKQVQITCATNYYALFSANTYSLANSSAYVQLVQVPNVGNGTTEVFFQLSDTTGTNNVLAFGVNSGSLYLREQVGGVNSDTTVAYNATSMRWLRLRHDGTNVYWETSPDAATWTVQRTKVPAIPVSKMILRLTAGYYGTETTPGTAIFDNVNVAGAPALTAAAALAGSGTLSATTTPRATTTAAPSGTGALSASVSVGKLARGVNISGAEWGSTDTGGDGTFPGSYANGNWHYDSTASVTYLAGRGIRYIRLCIAWERLQPTRLGAFDTTEQARITSYLNACQSAGVRVIIEPHSYARFREGNPTTTTRVLGTDLAASDIADFWTRMVAAFGSHSAIHGWELMNEPHDLPTTNTGGAFGATWDTSIAGWMTTNCTLTRSTAVTRTGSGALQMTVTAAGEAGTRSWFYVGALGSVTFAAYVRSLGAVRSAQFLVNWYTSAGAYISTTASGFLNATSTTWQQLTGTFTPPGGAYRGEFILDVLGGAAGEAFLWDDLTSNATAVQTGAQVWEAACQTIVTAMRGAGDQHVIYIPGYSYQSPVSWTTNHPIPFVTDPQNNIKYAAHLYYDDNNAGVYAQTYAQEVTNATGQGYASVAARAVARLNTFAAWGAAYGVTVALTETGWPQGADAASWNTVGDALYSRADALGIDVWYWASGESWGTGYTLNPYDTNGGSALSRALPQATVVEAHLGVGSGPYRAAVAADAPTVWWHLDEASGTTLTDAVGGRTLTITGAPTLGAAGIAANDTGTASITFNNSTLQYAQAASNAIYSPAALTVEALVQSNGFNGNNRIVEYGSDSAWSLYYENGSLKFNVFGHGVAAYTWAGNIARHHVAGTYDSTTGTTRLYLDGAEVANQTNGVAGGVSTTDPLRLAQKPTGSFAGDGWNGRLGEVAIYDKVLAPARIAAHATAAALGTTASATAALTGTGALAATATQGGSVGTYRRGVASSGGEFGTGSIPGTYDTDYHYDRAQSLTYLASRGVKTTRLAFLWERLQRTLGGALDATELGRLTSYVSNAAAAGIGVILDVHNYARYNGLALGSPGGPTQAHLVDFWTKVSTAFKGNAGVIGYGLMNEPHDLPGSTGTFTGTTRYNYDASTQSVDTGGTSWTATVDTTRVRTGAGSLKVARAAGSPLGSGFQFVRLQESVQGTGSGNVMSAFIWQDVGTPNTWQARLEYQNSSFTWVGSDEGYVNLTPGQWTEVRGTWASGLPATPNGFAIQIQTNTATASQAAVFNVDDWAQGSVSGAQTGVQQWQAASQACVTAIRANGDTKTILVPGYAWASVATWAATNGSTGWITDSASNFLYEGHHYWDTDHSGTYGSTYAAYNTAIQTAGTTPSGGNDAITTRTLAEINAWLTWLATNSAKGYVGEFGWPQGTADATSWNALASAWFARADAGGLWATQWATGEWWGAYVLSVYKNDANGFVGATTTASPILEAHLGGSGPALTAAAALSGAGTLTATATATQGGGTTASLTDDFTTAASTKWNGYGTGVAATYGQLRITPTPAYPGLTAQQTYSMVGSSAAVQVMQAPNNGNGSLEMMLSVGDAAGNYAAFLWASGRVSARERVSSTNNDGPYITHDPNAMWWWRVRADATTTYWEYSADGQSWTVLRSKASGFSMGAVTPRLSAGYWGTEPGPGVAIFDNFNVIPAPPASPRTFYIDPAGSDDATGTTTGTAWATLNRVSTTQLYPGDTVLLKRGGTWTGSLRITGGGSSASPITVGAYGAGASPIVSGGGSSGVAGTSTPCEIAASWVVLDGVEVRGGNGDDITIYGTDCTVQNCTVRWGVYGINQMPSAARAKILNNVIVDVNVGRIGAGPDDDSGAMGVEIQGDGAEVAYNTISGCVYSSPDYGPDGSAVEVYGATNAVIHHNRAIDCVAFVEMGKVGTSNITIHTNVATSTISTGTGILVHGADSFGPVLGTKAYHNTIVLPDPGSGGLGVWVGSGGQIDLRNNIVVVAGSTDSTVNIGTGSTVTEAGNVFWNPDQGPGGGITIPGGMAASSVAADPMFVGGGDYRLRVGSPAVNRGVNLGYATDYAGNPRLVGAAPDSGAYEGAVGVGAPRTDLRLRGGTGTALRSDIALRSGVASAAAGVVTAALGGTGSLAATTSATQGGGGGTPTVTPGPGSTVSVNAPERGAMYYSETHYQGTPPGGGGSAGTTQTDSFTGTNGAAPSSTNFSVSATTGSSATIQTNALRLVTGTAGGYADAVRVTSTLAATTDVEVTLDVTAGSSTIEAYFDLMLRATGTGGSLAQGGYKFEIANSGAVSIQKVTSFSGTVLGSGTVAGYAAGTVVHIDAAVSGSTLSLYAWTGATKPGTPTVQVTDATYTGSGGVGFYLNGGNAAGAAATWTVDNWSATTGGTSGTGTPATGYVPLSASAVASAVAAGQTQVFRYFYIERYMTTDTIEQAFLDLITADMAIIRNNGAKAIIRFAYSNNDVETYPYANPDPGVTRSVAHIQQLAPTLNANADVIEAVEAGFIGIWGEWYYTVNYSAGTDPNVLSAQNWIDRKAILTALLSNLDARIFVLVRYAGIKPNYFGGTTVPADPTQAGYWARMGYHDDALGATADDWGTFITFPWSGWSDPLNNSKAFVASDTGTYALPWGGEIGSNNVTYAAFKAEMSQFHANFWNPADFGGSQATQGWTAANQTELRQLLGHRLRLVSSSVVTGLAAGASTTVSVTIANDGWGRPLRQNPVWVDFVPTGGGQATSTRLTGVDPRTWAPGGQYTISGSVTAPATAGTYTVHLRITDPSNGLTGSAAYCLPLVNTGTYDASTGRNALGVTATVTAGGSSAFTATAGLAGSGTLTATTSATQGNARTVAAGLAGSGALATTPTPKVTLAAALTGSGTLGAAGVRGGAATLAKATAYRVVNGSWVASTVQRL